MKILELIKNYRNVDNFSDRPVEKAKLDRVLKAINFSPVGSDKIPLKTILISENNIKQKLRQTAEQVEKAYTSGTGSVDNSNGSNWQKPFLEEAPFLIVVCSLTAQPYQAFTTWLSLGNLIKTATKEGLGSLCYAPSMPAILRKVLSISSKYMPVAIIPIGYPSGDLFLKTDPAEEKILNNLFSGRFNWQ